jgi:peptidoglycan-N-acetylglucosamine deacetylase
VTEPRLVCCGRSDERAIAITFDDGPSGTTPAILDALAEFGAHATFFVVGEWVERRPEIVRDAAARGHELGNHTWTHPDARRVSDLDMLRDEVRRTSEVLERTVGRAPSVLRPPYGAEPGRFARVTAEQGLDATVLWTVQAVDYEDASDDERIAAAVNAEAHPGAIVLLHDGWAGRDHNSRTPQGGTLRALPRILERLAGDGYRFVTVSELLAA